MTFIYGSCGSKLCTCLNSIIMVNEINNSKYDDDASGLFNKLLTTNAYGLLTDIPLDAELYKRHTPEISSNNRSYPTGAGPKLGFKHMFLNTFYTTNINSPAGDTKWLTLKRLMYMNTPLNDFDEGINPLGKVACPYNEKLLCDCKASDIYWIGFLQVNNNIKQQSVWLNWSGGPFQWLQMANTCDSSAVAPLGKWLCGKDSYGSLVCSTGTPSKSGYASQYECENACGTHKYACDPRTTECYAADNGSYNTVAECQQVCGLSTN
jgi:hypothetical protein